MSLRVTTRHDVDVVIRRYCSDDIDAVHDMLLEPAVIRGILQIPHSSREVRRARFDQSLADGNDSIMLVAEVDGAVVGCASLIRNTRPRMQHAATLGMNVRESWHGKGIGGALLDEIIDMCDKWLQVRRVDLTVFIDNEPAIGLYRSRGFEVEGTHRMFAFREGEYVDAHAMARVRPW